MAGLVGPQAAHQVSERQPSGTSSPTSSVLTITITASKEPGSFWYYSHHAMNIGHRYHEPQDA